MQGLISYITFLITYLSAILVLALPVQAQSTEEDSLRQSLSQFSEKDTAYVMTLLELANKVRLHNVDEAIEYTQEAIVLARQLPDQKHLARALNIQGIAYGMQNKYADAIQSFIEASRLFQQEELWLLLGSSYNNLSLVYRRMGDFPQSMAYMVKAEHLYDSIDYQIGIARISNNLGSLFSRQNELELAKSAYQKALASYRSLDETFGIASAQLNLGVLYQKMGDYTAALKLLDSTLAYCTIYNIPVEKVEAKIGLANTYLCIATEKAEDIRSQAELYRQAETYLTEALADTEQLGLGDLKASALTYLALLEANRGNAASSIRYALEVRSITDSLNSLILNSNAEEILAYVYKKAGQWQQAFEHHERYKAWQDSLYSEQTAALYKAQQVQMEVAQKERELAEQSVQLASLNEKVALENKWKWALGTASLLLLLAGILYYQKYQDRKVYAQRIESVNLQLEATDDTVNYFASSLYGKNTVDEILWDVAKNCISSLGLKDCVIYLLDKERQVLVQKAAYGPKNPKDFTIHDPIEIPLGQGIVGSVAQSGEGEIVQDTSRDARYIVDDDSRLSELAVPIIHQGKVIGVIDSEHPERNFYTDYHWKALKTITAICASKIAQAQADEESRKAEETRQEAEQIKAMDLMKSRFFANISHEFRTPLHLILGPLRSHQNDQIPTHELGMMQRNAQRLLRLVNQLMDLSKLEVGQLQLECQPADAFEFIRNIADSFIPLAEEKSLNYQIDIPLRPAPLRFDPDKVEKIVYNLLSNAIKFTPSGGKVSIHAVLEEAQRLRLSVSDTGLGIPGELQDKIFDRFYQVDGSNTRAFEGTGIGLALIKELVDLHAGTITLDSAPGFGANFTVVLPLKEAKGERLKEVRAMGQMEYSSIEAAETVPRISTAISEELPLLLLVEDNTDLRRYICDHLGVHFQIKEAIHGKEGWEMATEQIPDIIITDVMMPEMDGVELTQRLKDDERTSHIPILMLTAREDTETKRAGFQTGADQYLTKPFDLAELQDRLQNLLRQRRRLRDKYSHEVTLRPKEITVDDRDGAFVQKIMEVIEREMSNSAFGVDQLQREIGMSRMQLHRKLKALTDQSPGELMRTVRMQRAAQMLEQPGIQITEVAYAVGFTSPSYFASSFRKHFGVAPSDYPLASQN